MPSRLGSGHHRELTLSPGLDLSIICETLHGNVVQQISENQPPVQFAAPLTGLLKPESLERIQYAAEILRSHLENPPNQTVLAQQVGVSDRTLQKGFRAVFRMTVRFWSKCDRAGSLHSGLDK